jgi:D-alanyl-D-alanine dipeptidase
MRWLILFVLTILNFAAAAATESVARARQLIVVSAPSWESEMGELEMLSKTDGGKWVRHGREVAVVLGHGLAWGRGLHAQPKSGPMKREGDRRAPAGIFAIGPAFGYAAKPPAGCRLPYHPITEQDYFVDDPDAKEYNRWVRLPPDADPNQRWRSAEKMRRTDFLYQLGIVIHHNMDPVMKGQGSAIFFHVWRNSSTPTVGCTAMDRSDMMTLLKWIDPKKRPLLIQAPTAELPALRAQINSRDGQN